MTQVALDQSDHRAIGNQLTDQRYQSAMLDARVIPLYIRPKYKPGIPDRTANRAYSGLGPAVACHVIAKTRQVGRERLSQDYATAFNTRASAAVHKDSKPSSVTTMRTGENSYVPSRSARWMRGRSSAQ